jgi:hypothetical protein
MGFCQTETRLLIVHILEREPIEVRQLYGLAPPEFLLPEPGNDIRKELWVCCFQGWCRRTYIKRNNLRRQREIPLIPITREEDKSIISEMNCCRDIMKKDKVMLFACASHFYPKTWSDNKRRWVKPNMTKLWLTNGQTIPDDYIIQGPVRSLTYNLKKIGGVRRKRNHNLILCKLWDLFLQGVVKTPDIFVNFQTKCSWKKTERLINQDAKPKPKK